MFMFVLYFQLLLVNMFVFLLSLDTIVCHSIGYTFYDQSLCYVLLFCRPISQTVFMLSIAINRAEHVSGFVRGITKSYKVLYLFLKNKTSYKVLYFIGGLIFN